MTEITHVALTSVNVTYSEITKLSKSHNMHRMLTRSTFAHAQNHTKFKSHPLVTIKHTIFENYHYYLHKNMISQDCYFLHGRECASGECLVHIFNFL